MKGISGWLFFFLWHPSPYSSEVMQRWRRHPSDWETSAHVTDWRSPRGVPGLVMPTPVLQNKAFITSSFSSGWFGLFSHTSLSLLDGVAPSESQTGKPPLSFVNKGKPFESRLLKPGFLICLWDFIQSVLSSTWYGFHFADNVIYFLTFRCRWFMLANVFVLTCR